jgi:TatA/E family protein of Tat protein translocase
MRLMMRPPSLHAGSRQAEGSVFGIGMSEMLVILGVALLVFGPTELPTLAKKIAKGMREVRRASDDLRRSIELEDDVADHRFRRPPPEPPPEPPAAIAGSVLTESDEPGPVVVPVAAVAVGSHDADATPEGSESPSPEPEPALVASSAVENGRG